MGGNYGTARARQESITLHAMPSPGLLLAVVCLLLLVLMTVDFIRGGLSIRLLRDVIVPGDASAPRVSVVIAARNEERNIEPALRSVLAQDYPNLEIVVVDDRSEDRTASILSRLAVRQPLLTVVRIDQLPAGWLGKNHALQEGANAATGDWILFTDADVVMNPSTIRRAIWLVTSGGIDHLAGVADMTVPGSFLRLFVMGFILYLNMYLRPWKARDPKSRCYIGIGAFNLVRSDIYRAVGGHTAIAMRPDDDLRLGQLLKRSGYRQDIVSGHQVMEVEWYHSMRELVLGLEKNQFAALNYSLVITVLGSLAHLLLALGPIAGVIWGTGLARWIWVLVVLVTVLGYAVCTPYVRVRWWYALGYPLVAVLFNLVLWRSTLLTLTRRGIRWRGTYYSLRDLKANRAPF